MGIMIKMEEGAGEIDQLLRGAAALPKDQCSRGSDSQHPHGSSLNHL